MKKIISILMCVVLLITTFSVCAFAESSKYDGILDNADTETPVIFVSGYGDSYFYTYDEDNNYVSLSLGYTMFVEPFTKAPEKFIFPLIKGLIFGNYDSVVKTYMDNAERFGRTLKYLSMDESGKSNYDVQVVRASVSQSRGYSDSYGAIDEFIIENTGMNKNNFFTFHYDWRKGHVENASILNEYIKEVKAVTGKEKVSLFCYSLGGQVGETYLKYYGKNQDVKRVVVDNSPLDGTSLASSLLTTDLDMDLLSAYKAGMGDGADTDILAFLLGKLKLGFLDNALSSIVNNIFAPEITYWPSTWDLLPTEDYEVLKDKFLDKDKNAGIIAQSDKYHYEVASCIPEIIAQAESDGITVSQIVNTNLGVVTQKSVNSDGVVEAKHSCGVTVTDNGKIFDSTYVQKNNCGHNHISPERNMDASTCYLPERTWFVLGQSHGMAFTEEYTQYLSAALLTTDNLENVFTDSRFPQYELSSFKVNAVRVSFENTDRYGFISKDGKSITIKNLSGSNTILTYVKIQGVKVSDPVFGKKINPGDSISFGIEGLKNLESGSVVTVRVDQLSKDSMTGLYLPFTSTYNFTVL